MCQRNHTIIFCTCTDKAKEEKKGTLLKRYKWTLTKFLGQKSSSIRGKVAIPDKDLGNDITLETVLEALNSNEQVFDFRYKPRLKDCLYIRTRIPNEGVRYLNVIYKEEGWVQGSNPVFTSVTKRIAKGNILKLDPTEEEDLDI